MKLTRQVTQKPSTFLYGEAACICLLVLAQAAWANPTGGTVAAGDASISTSGTTTTITQTTQKAIINWHDFSINQNETTQFIQPSSSSVILNRVTSGNVSQIMGNLKANGQVYLINPNGILFGSTAVVNVGGLVASTSPISDSDFMNDSIQRFNQSNTGASIINEGSITIKNAGLAVLVSPTVINNGVIIADLGVVSIASADHFTLDLYGDNLITLDVGKVLQSDGLVENNGTLQANGGKIYITAQAADDMLENVVNMNGYISAQTVSTQKGKVVLQGYDNSTINIAGHIDISGDEGGTMEASATNINLLDNAYIDASGLYGGGLVNIGGEYQGGGTLAHADYVTMLEHAVINADALESGHGGQIVLWADNTTLAYGTLTARGGMLLGDGGMIETSAHYLVDVGGAKVSAGAANGQKGLWLTDPLNDDVSDAEAAAYSFALDNNTDVTIWALNDVTFSNTLTNVTWVVGNGVFTVRSDFDQDGTGTILLNGACTAGVTCIVSTLFGTINYYYNPTVFGTPDPFPSVITAGPAIFNPYMLVNNAVQLQAIGTDALTLSRFYALNRDIAGIGAFVSLGGQGSGNDFTGNFTGALYQDDTGSLTQYTLSGMTINGAGVDSVGLFGQTNGATIMNVSLTGSSITGKDYVGSIVGRSLGGTEFIGDFSVTNGTILGESFVGGLFGDINAGVLDGNFTFNSGTVTGTTNSIGGIIGRIGNTSSLSASTQMDTLGGTITGGSIVGGLVGLLNPTVTWNATGTFTNYATVNGTASTGGLIGNTFSDIPTNLTNYGTVTGTSATGGIFGLLQDAAISGVLNNYGNVTGTTQVGGIVGWINTLVLTSLTTAVQRSGTITGTSQVGGIAGESDGSITFASVLSGTTIVGTGTDIGGIVGYNDGGLVSNTSFAGSISASGATNVGGLVGFNDAGGVLTSLGIGAVTGNTNVGALIGNNGAGSLAQDLLYDTNINPTLSAIGTNAGTVDNVSGATYTTLGTWNTYFLAGFSAANWQVLTGNYASLIFCGSSCATTLFIPASPSAPVSDNIVDTQLVNAENEYRQKIPIELAILVDLVLTYGNEFMGELNIPNNPDGMMASWFLTNSIILEIGFLLGDDPESSPIGIMKDVMEIISEHLNCA